MRSRFRVLGTALTVILALLAGPTIPARAIVGGITGVEAEAPWSVMLIRAADGYCSGQLISSDLVLTARHCTNGITAGQITVKFAGGARRSAIDKYENADGHDIALLRLISPVSGVAPLRLASSPSTVESFVDRGVTFYGWGTTSVGGPMSDVVRKTPDGAYQGAPFCQSYFGPTGSTACFLKTRTFGEDGIAVLPGDSGGAWVGWVDGAWTLLAVERGGISEVSPASRGPEGGASVGAPAVREWIWRHLGSGPHAVVDCGVLGNTLPRNDDGSTGSVAIGFPLRFFGRVFDHLFVNNNGNVSFDGALSEYVPFNLSQTSVPIIAPFFSDIDTRNSLTSPVTFGPITYGGRRALCVNWLNVGEYNSRSVPNDIQLLLVDRSSSSSVSDPSYGDFDVVFNYDRILWDHTQVRAGYSNGSGGLDPGSALELTGSGVAGAFLDTNLTTGLIHNYAGQSPVSPQLGRYVFPVRNGAAPPPGTMAGRVSSNGSPPANIQGALVSACRASAQGGGCRTGATNDEGQYTLAGLPAGDYTIGVSPPSGSSFAPRSGVGPVTVVASPMPVIQDIVLSGPQGLPPNTVIGGALRGTQPGQVPVVVVNRTIDISATGCDGGTGIVRVYQGGSQRSFLYRDASDSFISVLDAPMSETPPGTYTVHIRLPFTGTAEVRLLIEGCPDRAFNVYIDPSGFVRTTDGAPIVGATVVLYRINEAGAAEVVPNGSAVMSPSNRRNPDATDASGHFGWDVIEGTYFVRASAQGCHAPGNAGQAHVDTANYTIPPPVLDIDMRFACETPPPTTTTTSSTTTTTTAPTTTTPPVPPTTTSSTTTSSTTTTVPPTTTTSSTTTSSTTTTTTSSTSTTLASTTTTTGPPSTTTTAVSTTTTPSTTTTVAPTITTSTTSTTLRPTQPAVGLACSILQGLSNAPFLSVILRLIARILGCAAP